MSGLPLLNRVMTLFGATLVAPLPGRMVTTCGALLEMSAAVVNLLWKFARLLPVTSWMPVLAITVISVLGGKYGESVTVRLSDDIVGVTGSLTPPERT